MTLCKGSRFQIINHADGKLEEGGVQRIFEDLEYSGVDYETNTQLIRVKVVV